MCIKKPEAVRAYAYQMLLRFKTSVTIYIYIYIYIQNSRRKTVSVVKQSSPKITQFFAGHCPMSVANIQACRLLF